jgi:hypothetical protein
MEFLISINALLISFRLPHAHIMVFLNNEDKPRKAEDYDRFVCAELPDPEKQPKLFELVTKFMIHGPCQPIVKTGPACLDEKGICTKDFPKDFQAETWHSEKHYPSYRRRRPEEKGGHIANIPCRHLKGYEIRPDGSWGPPTVPLDNRWVVPYNPILLYRSV